MNEEEKYVFQSLLYNHRKYIKQLRKRHYNKLPNIRHKFQITTNASSGSLVQEKEHLLHLHIHVLNSLIKPKKDEPWFLRFRQ